MHLDANFYDTGNRETLLKEIQDLTSILAHCEPDLMKNLNNHKQVFSASIC